MKSKRQKVLTKSYCALHFGFYDKDSEEEGSYNSCPPPLLRDIGLNRHTFNINHYLHKRYLHKKFILAYIRITKLLKKTISRSLLKKLVL